MVIKIGDHYFEKLIDYREAFNEEQFENRYSEVLDKYPIIVGDIGYEQLRLKGFYEDRNKKADFSRRFSSIQDYLMEYCNFGCPYFVLKRLTTHEVVRLETDDGLEMEEVLHEDAMDEAKEDVIEQADESSSKTFKNFMK